MPGNALWTGATAVCDDKWSLASPVTDGGDKGYPGAGFMIIAGHHCCLHTAATALVGMTAAQFTTCWFQSTKSIAKVAEHERWRALEAMRLYFATALQEWALDTMPNEV